MKTKTLLCHRNQQKEFCFYPTPQSSTSQDTLYNLPRGYDTGSKGKKEKEKKENWKMSGLLLPSKAICYLAFLPN